MRKNRQNSKRKRCQKSSLLDKEFQRRSRRKICAKPNLKKCQQTRAALRCAFSRRSVQSRFYRSESTTTAAVRDRGKGIYRLWAEIFGGKRTVNFKLDVIVQMNGINVNI